MAGECDRCGECCRRSTPALHEEDLKLIGESGGLDLVHLVTFRRGELVHDQVRGVLAPLHEEVVKLRSRPHSWECFFLNEDSGDGAGCGRYEQRPLECKLLLCKNPAPLAEAYATGRITRLDIVGGHGAVAELIAAHEDQCGYEELAAWARRLHLDASNREAAETILAAVHFDARAREILTGRLPEMNEEDRAAVAACCLGRPLAETLSMFGLSIARQEDGAIRLSASGTIHHPAARP
ncbi:YkgJ family cysteine cluster protein [Oceanidesulfovibrio indonesiensis]|nr:YkgJ family cysteine cluster protein [Oceanidesulfovibrio indonesiensis]